MLYLRLIWRWSAPPGRRRSARPGSRSAARSAGPPPGARRAGPSFCCTTSLSRCSRRFNRDGEGMSAEWQISRRWPGQTPPSLPAVGVQIGMERGCQQDGRRLAGGQGGPRSGGRRARPWSAVGFMGERRACYSLQLQKGLSIGIAAVRVPEGARVL